MILFTIRFYGNGNDTSALAGSAPHEDLRGVVMTTSLNNNSLGVSNEVLTDLIHEFYIPTTAE